MFIFQMDTPPKTNMNAEHHLFGKETTSSKAPFLCSFCQFFGGVFTEKTREFTALTIFRSWRDGTGSIYIYPSLKLTAKTPENGWLEY